MASVCNGDGKGTGDQVTRWNGGTVRETEGTSGASSS